MTNRRDFLKTMAIGGASAIAVPSLLNSCSTEECACQGATAGNLIVPKDNGLRITGTFLDEISHDIPHQNWSEKEWDQDFAYMKSIGIDTVIDIRCGYRKFITYPSPYLLKKGCYMPSVDLIDMFCRLAQKHGMKFYLGLYDSGVYWDTKDMSHEIEDNKFVIDEVWKMTASEDGTSAPRSAVTPSEQLTHSTQWAHNARRSQAECRYSSLHGLTARRL